MKPHLQPKQLDSIAVVYVSTLYSVRSLLISHITFVDVMLDNKLRYLAVENGRRHSPNRCWEGSGCMRLVAIRLR